MFALFVLSNLPGYTKTDEIQCFKDFDKIRIPRRQVICKDFGVHKTYCDHHSLPGEFIVTNERGIFFNEIVIKPRAMFTQMGNEAKIKMADFYYRFDCEDEIKLELNIVPKKNFDRSPSEELTLTIIGLTVLLIIFSVMTCFCSGDAPWCFLLFLTLVKKEERTFCE